MAQQINFYDSLLLPKKPVLGGARLLAGVAALMGILATVFGYGHYAVSRLEIEARASEASVVASQSRLRQVTRELAAARKNGAGGPIAELEAQLQLHERLAALLDPRLKKLSAEMDSLIRPLPDGMRLAGFEWGGNLALHGHARRPELVLDYLRRLKAEPLWAGRQVAQLEIVRSSLPGPGADQDAVEFRVSVGAAPTPVKP